MLRPSLVAVAAIGFASTAAAQSCPPGASTAASIPEGTNIRVIGLHPDDAYYEGSYANIVGVSGRTTGALNNNGGCWFGGPVANDSGDSWYFYKAAIAVTGGSAPAPSSGTACPSGALRGNPTNGQSYTVLGLHPDDAYTGGTTVTTGMRVTFDGETQVRDGCWISGSAARADGTSLYFYKVAVQGGGRTAPAPRGGGLVLNSCPSNAARGRIPAGTRIRFLGVNPDDAYSSGTSSFAVGDVLTAKEELTNHGECWFGGPVEAPANDGLYFYKGAFEIVRGEAGPGGSGDLEKDIQGQIRALPSDESLDQDVKALLLRAYDRDRSGMLDTRNEVNSLPCDVAVAIGARYRQKWDNSVRVILGLHSDYIWVGGAIGFAEPMRAQVDRRFDQCGVSR